MQVASVTNPRRARAQAPNWQGRLALRGHLMCLSALAPPSTPQPTSGGGLKQLVTARVFRKPSAGFASPLSAVIMLALNTARSVRATPAGLASRRLPITKA
eukprot:8850342-Alexandrium_andersonii.AAC.1